MTGHTGFKGAWLSLWLHELGARVTGLSLPAQVGALYDQARLADLFDHVEGDIRDRDVVETVVARARPEVVFHLAAQALVRASYADPVGTFATNVMGTVHVLDALRRSPCARAVVCVTSDKAYENRDWIWPYRESDPMGGHDPYSASKGCAELVVASFRRSYFPPDRLAEYGLGVASARAGNVLGGGDRAADRLAPELLAAFARGETAVVRNPGAVRPWQFVLEPLAGYLALAERLLAGEAWAADAWNFGPEARDARPVAVVADVFARCWGAGARWVPVGDPGAPHEAAALRLDASKARSLLRWRPLCDLDEAIAWTVAFERRDPGSMSAREAALGQIRGYADRLASSSMTTP